MDTRLPTEEEKEIIIKSVDKCGELYHVFGLDTLEFEPTNEEIKNAYLSKIKNLKKNSTLLNDYKECYKILSNDRLREIYDLFFLQAIIHKQYQKTMIIKNSFTIVISSVSYALQRVHGLSASKLGFTKPIRQVSREIYSNRGVFGFYRGYIGAIVSVFPENIIHTMVMGLVDIFMGKCNLQTIPFYEHFRTLVTSITHIMISSPHRFLLECAWMSPYGLSIFQVLKKVILREQVLIENGISKTQFNFKNIFYAFGSRLLLHLASDLIFRSLCALQVKIDDQSKKNPNSQFWKYSNLIYGNVFFQGTLNALLVSPFEVTRLQYSADFVKSYINGTPIPRVLNPIQMVQKIINTQGIAKLYNGCSILSIVSIVNLFNYNNSIKSIIANNNNQF